jgi:hypothetical protein
MGKKHKQQEHKEPVPEETTPAAPPGASFDTEEGRAAHGMRKDLGSDAPAHATGKEETDEEEER